MENLHQVALVGTCLLLLCCPSALLVKPSAKIWPPQLSLPMGATAVFTCNTSNVFISEYHLNWYRLDSSGQPKRLDSVKKLMKYNITRLNSRVHEMKILSVEKNDSGIYYCTLLAFSLNETLMESNKANLLVTEKAPEPGPMEKEGEGKKEDKKNGENGHPDHSILLGALGGAGLVVVLAFACFFLTSIIKKRKGRKKSQDENAPLEEEPPGVTVFTVDYGVLEFQLPGKARKAPPPKRSPSDQTEYATIVFPPEKPIPAKAGKMTKNLGKCPSSVPPC